MAKLVQPAKYLPSEWHTSNATNYSKAESERASAELLRSECERLRKETSATTQRTQAANEHKFSQRVRDIQFWRSELEEALSINHTEMTLLLGDKDKLELALQTTQLPLDIANSCIVLRQSRVAIDNVHDQVEIELHKEVKVIQEAQELLQRTLENATEQLRLLRSAKYKLDRDLTDKLSALGIDDTCQQLSQSTQGIGFTTQDVLKVHTKSVSPEQWEASSTNNLSQAETQRQASISLRGNITTILAQTNTNIQKQRAMVNLEFSKRISEMSIAHSNLEQHLNKVNTEIVEMEANIASLEEAISDHAPPMMLAHTRLDLRSGRPQRELVRDPTQYGLVEEVAEISQSLSALRTRLAESVNALKALLRSQLILEEDLAVKNNSLFIDQEQCMTLRKQLDN